MKLQELIVTILESKKATRSELASVISVHPDTLTKIKNNKYNLSEEKAEAYTKAILEVYPQEAPVEEQPEDEAGLVEGKKSTTVEYLVNAYGFKPQKIRRILRKLFGETHEKGKTWTLTTEQFNTLEASLLASSKGGEVK